MSKLMWETYNRDGYVLLRNMMPADRLNKVWMNLHMLVVKQLERFAIKPVADMKKNLEALLDEDPTAYVNMLRLASRLASVQDLLNVPLQNGLTALSTPVLHVLAHSLKMPSGYFGTAAHQDWSSAQGSLDTITIWVPITNTNANFPLEVVPGSHMRGLLLGKPNGSVLEVEAKDSDFEIVEAQFGDIVIMSGFTIHRTGSGGNGLRVAASIRYENVIEKSFIERGYPSAQSRTVDREIKWSPNADDVKGMFEHVD